jgi:Cof subfamily protein (haloacid dehalogenase superfamily)
VIPLVLLDLDGTMIGSNGQVAPAVFAVVDRLREHGVRLAVCTGRPALGIAQRIAARIGPTNPHIFQSGAQIVYPNGETLHVSALKEEGALALVRHARERNLVLELYTPQHVYVERKTPLAEAHARMIGVNVLVRDLGDVVANEPVLRAQWVVAEADEGAAMAAGSPGMQVSRATSPAQPGTLFISLTRAGVSKGSAVEQLAQHLKIPLAHAMGVGDSAGDLPMLERVGFPVVMGNAEASLKARFPRVVGDVDALGVIDALMLSLELKAG